MAGAPQQARLPQKRIGHPDRSALQAAFFLFKRGRGGTAGSSRWRPEFERQLYSAGPRGPGQLEGAARRRDLRVAGAGEAAAAGAGDSAGRYHRRLLRWRAVEPAGGVHGHRRAGHHRRGAGGGTGHSEMKEKLVIIGNGMAPGRALEKLLELKPDAYDITIFNAEPRVNYDRIMLSPVLSGEKQFDDIVIHGDAWYIKHGIMLYKGCKVTSIDRESKTVTAASGLVEPYDKLVIATGSVPFIIPVPGNNLAGVLTYRDLD